MTEVAEVLFQHHKLVYSLFDYYCLFGGGDELFHISQTSFLAFANSVIPTSKPAQRISQKMHLLQAFVAVDNRPLDNGADCSTVEKYNKKHMLCRYEWLGVLVRIAISRYMDTGKMSDVSESLERLFECDIIPRIPPEAGHDAYEFRHDVCYQHDVHEVLRAHLHNLRTLFEVYSSSPDVFNETADPKLLGCSQWIRLVQQAKLVDATEFTRRKAGEAM